ncbi:hypothetical protein B7494_g8422 [Chlorociboria aeruginascens]|nr:hypothetical protein B7494_g8422 [Chlorociboria aeruginascens]
MMSKTFSVADVASHKDADSMFIIVDSGVYDVTGKSSPIPEREDYLRAFFRGSEREGERFVNRGAEFVNEHPGGAKILKRVAGKDATKQFWKYHNESVLKKYGAKLQVGTVQEKAKL